jgi:hypothetical protein
MRSNSILRFRLSALSKTSPPQARPELQHIPVLIRVFFQNTIEYRLCRFCFDPDCDYHPASKLAGYVLSS